jgi:acyl dehydratase
MGQLPAAVMAAAVGRWLGRETIVGYGVRFRAKVWPGDRLVLRGRLLDGTDGFRSCELEARRVSDDTVVMTGWARAGGPPG